MKDYREKISKLAAQPRWKRVAFALGLNGLLLWRHLLDFYLYLNFHFPRRPFSIRTKPRAHYLGSLRPKPHRFAFLLLASLLITGVVRAPGPLAALQWAIAWGGILSLWVALQSLSLVVKRIRS